MANTDKLISAAEAGELDPGASWSRADAADFEKMREADEAWATERADAAVRERDPSPEPAEPTAPTAPTEDPRQEAETWKRNYHTLEQRTNLLLQRMAQPQQQAPQQPQYQIPDAQSDPVGHLISKVQLLERHAIQQEAGRQQQAQFQQHAQAIGGLIQHAQQKEREFESEHPDYAAAVARLTEVRHKELQMAGMTDYARHAHIQREGLELAAGALQQNRNPSEVIYELAQLRGHVPQSTRERFGRIQQGMQMSKSLGNARGSSPAPLSANRLLSMSDDEFAAALQTRERMQLLGA
jgi:hypothetical protein